ncbi:unnamed protein product [Rangifer tarandus platyrhynchus]|uniref:Uncharacterized protein n=1 Tax=Rangifer tarandus platyrhynchus TaxID=3082113 RepID=A0ABN9A547_RANTA|nr:unnamed protein product [Rangifer tarandus platyrhynchus]
MRLPLPFEWGRSDRRVPARRLGWMSRRGTCSSDPAPHGRAALRASGPHPPARAALSFLFLVLSPPCGAGRVLLNPSRPCLPAASSPCVYRPPPSSPARAGPPPAGRESAVTVPAEKGWEHPDHRA